jgi:hypothetical protein
MKRKLSPFLFAFVILIMLSLADQAKACIPIGGPEPPCSAYWKADSVFVGIISGIKKLPREPQPEPAKLLLRFSVLQPFRGIETKQVKVVTTTGSDCDEQYRKGEKWLVYAHRDSTGQLMVLSRIVPYDGAGEDLVYIYSLSQRVQPSIIVGVYDDPYTPAGGIKIEIEGEGHKYQGVTDKDGRVSIPVAEAGRYLIRAIFPAEASLVFYEQPREPPAKNTLRNARSLNIR